ncbi:MAG TPA: hypothetical protein PKE47_15575 [Verrucomicrobiota bacterium]|nr:hypothetical protein [Verrucomicrobiota bacterium]
MIRALLTGLLLAATLSLTTGCYSSLDGRSRAGVPFKRDRIEGRYERTVAQAAAAARQVLMFNGTIVSDDVVTGVLVGQIDRRRAFVEINEIEPGVTRVLVQVRTSGGGADIELAAELQKQIALRLQAAG